jgi:hypothetical protein
MALINFPTIHIANSVVNRILNVHSELAKAKPTQKGNVVRPQPYQAPAPQRQLLGPVQGDAGVPDATPLGQQLDMQMAQPTQPADAPPDVANQIALKGLL